MKNIITGYPDQTFRPNSYIKRGDVAAILQRSYQFPTVSEIYYSDVKNENYYDGAINSIAALNISSGYPDGTFKPSNYITRAEFSVLLANSMKSKK